MKEQPNKNSKTMAVQNQGLLSAYEAGGMAALQGSGINQTQQIDNYAFLHNTYSLNGVPTISSPNTPMPTSLGTGTITTYAENSPEGVSF
tara:strand:- start:3162 stop:3431 length:270 start_codon:yes stop_codon:yes gene_type:complete